MAPLNTSPYTHGMKHIIPAMLAVALTALPLGAYAGEAYAPNPAMAQMETQMHTLSVQARTAVLQAITPQHRQLLAQVVGGLAIAPNPDFAAASKQLDAALSQQESQNVLRISSQFHQQMHALMQANIQQMERNNPNGPGGPNAQVQTKVRTDGEGRPPMDAGSILLILAQPGMGMMHHVMIDRTSVTH